MYARDSSAALAISNRRGSGKLRHIAIGLLWIQEKVEEVANKENLDTAERLTRLACLAADVVEDCEELQSCQGEKHG